MNEQPYYEEACSCAASMKMPLLDGWIELVYDWRANHRHDLPPAGDMVVESGSSHERAAEEPFAESRVALGFQRR